MDPNIILDQSTGWDDNKTRVLDDLLARMHEGNPQEQNRALSILRQLETRNDLWAHAPGIIQDPQSSHDTKFLLLTILQKTIQTRWPVIPQDEKVGVRRFLGAGAMSLSVVDGVPQFLLQKFSSVLIDVVKHEWPENWPEFMTVLSDEARTDARKCQTVLNIFIGLADSIFDNDQQDITKQRREILQAALKESFENVSDLCSWIIELHRNKIELPQSLMDLTLKCLTAYVPFIPVSFVIQNQLTKLLCEEFFDISVRIQTISFLTEVLNIRAPGPNQRDLLPGYEEMVATTFAHVIDTTCAIPAHYMDYDSPGVVPANQVYFWEEFYMKIALFCSTALTKHYDTLTKLNASNYAIDDAVTLLVQMTSIPHDETFKILLDFWTVFLLELYKKDKIWNSKTAESKGFASSSSSVPLAVLGLSSASLADLSHCEEVRRFQDTLTKLRRTTLSRMVKPREIYITYDPVTGTLDREWEVDTEEVRLYGMLKDINILLTNLGDAEMIRVFDETLNSYTSDEKRGELANKSWNPSEFNKLCWAVGSVAGALSRDKELQFIVKMLKKLLWLCENKQGKENKSIVASMTMHIVGKYPRLLEVSRPFLEATVDKQFQFMREEFPGIQEMAVETLLKICRNVKSTISAPVKPGEKSKCEPGHSLLEWMVMETENVIPSFKSPRNVLLLYEALACCVDGLPQNARAAPLEIILKRPMEEFRMLIQDEQTFLSNLKEASRKMVVVFRTFVAVCSAVGLSFHGVFGHIFKDLCFLYRSFSEAVINKIEEGGPQVAGHEVVRHLRLCKKEILVLIGEFIQSIGTHDDSIKLQATISYVPPILQFVLPYYRSTPDCAKDLEVLRFCHTLAVHLSSALEPALGELFDCVFGPTLSLIQSDYHSYMDHRKAFYELLESFTNNCLEGILCLPTENLRMYVEILAFGASHEQPHIADLSLHIIRDFLKQLKTRSQDPTRHNQAQYQGLLVDFCKNLYYDMLGSVLKVTTDTMHKNGFFSQCEVLVELFTIITNGIVNVEESGLAPLKLKEWLCANITQEFGNMNKQQVEHYVEQLLATSCLPADSKHHENQFDQVVRDFLIDSKVFQSAEDFTKVNDARDAAAQQAEHKAYLQSVPGMVEDQTLKIAEQDEI